jgi:L-malate glycosyltransferase
MIKIAYLIDTIESPTAGTEKQLLLLIRHLDRSKFQPVLCVLRSSRWLEQEFDLCRLFVAGVESFKSPKGWGGIYRLVRFLRNEQVGVVQTHFRDSSIAGTLAARMAGVVTVVGTRRNQGYWLTPFEAKIQRFLDRWIDFYIANSQSTKGWVVTNEGVSPKRVAVINNGFDLATFPAEPRAIGGALRKELGIPESAPVVVIVANLRPVKDHGTFLRATRKVLDALPECHFLVVGAGEELPRLRDLAAELGVSSAVSFLGVRHDVPRLLALSDIGVLSSLSESFSNALVEYMAAGLPVVATDVGGAREAIDDGANGYVVPLGDWASLGERVVGILRSGRAAEMGAESRRRSIERFSLGAMVQKFEEIYRSVPGGAS